MGTVNNNVSLSLISVTVTPSTFLASLIVVIVLVAALYIPRSLPGIPNWLLSFPQRLCALATTSDTSPAAAAAATLRDKALPAPPYGCDDAYYYDQDPYCDSRLILQDQSLVLARPDLVHYTLNKHTKSKKKQNLASSHSSSASPAPLLHHEQSSRRHRLPAGLQPSVPKPLPLPQRPLERRPLRRREESPPSTTPPPPVRFRDRINRWILTTGVAPEPRQRRSQQQRALDRAR